MSRPDSAPTTPSPGSKTLNPRRNVPLASRRCSRRRRWLGLLALAAALHVLSAPALAQRRGPRAGPATQSGPAALPVQPFLDDFSAWLEGDLVALLQQRATTSP